jgi:hypothetical protein
VVEAANPKRPLPPVEVKTGDDKVPSSSDIFNETMLDPAGSFLRKYAALVLGLSLNPMAAAETSDGTRRYVRACILTEAQDLKDALDWQLQL